MTAGSFPSWNDLNVAGDAQIDLHARAAAAARARFGGKVFVRGVIEVSNFCRENCHYCGMRRDNRLLNRKRGQVEQLADLLIHHRPAAITDLNLQAGEDPVAVREVVLPLLQILRRETTLGLSVCLGTLRPELYAALREAGASIYILKFEMAEARRYETVEAPGTLSDRIANIRHLAATGWRVSSGFIAGLPGQTPDDALGNFRLASDLPLSGCSASPFVPGEETPLAGASVAGIDFTLNCMAALRLMRSDWVIPAVSALNIADAEGGYRRGLGTGANLCTINLTPTGLREDYLLYKRDRCIMTEDRILKAIDESGLEPSIESLADFYQRETAAARATSVLAVP